MSGSNKSVPIHDSMGVNDVVSEDNKTTQATSGLNERLKNLREAEDPHAPLPTPPQNTKIDKVPAMLRETTKDKEKIFEPRVVSIGPYHHGKPTLIPAEKLKLQMANQFIKRSGKTDQHLYQKILDEIQILRECYEEEPTKTYNDEALAWMLFVDGCAIMHFIHCDNEKMFSDMRFKPHHVAFVHQDLFLLENQLPWRVLDLLMNESDCLKNGQGMKKIKQFLDSHIKTPERTKRKKAKTSPRLLPLMSMPNPEEEMPISLLPPPLSESPAGAARGDTTASARASPAVAQQSSQFIPKSEEERPTPQPQPRTMETVVAKKKTEQHCHLLELFRTRLVGVRRNKRGKQRCKPSRLLKRLLENLLRRANSANLEEKTYDWHSFRNITELIKAGIVLKPSYSNCLINIYFKPHVVTSNLYLPPIIIDDSTKAKFLNMIAYEMSLHVSTDSTVTSYVCFLDSLIDHPEDVKELREANIIHNFLGSDLEVATLFNELTTDLVPNSGIYSGVQAMIQNHYDSSAKTWMAQVVNEHFSSPWTIIAFSGAIIAILISFIQTYYTIFPHAEECDGLCKHLKEALIKK